MTYTEAISAFRSLPLNIQTYWSNACHYYNQLCKPAFYSGPIIIRRTTPIELFWRSCQWAEALGEQLPPQQPYWVPGYPPYEPDIGPVAAFPFPFPPLKQFPTVPDIAENYPREKYRVTRSYWTGTPRRRRNRT